MNNGSINENQDFENNAYEQEESKKPQYSFLERCTLIFYRPSEVAKDIKKKPDFLWIILLSMTLTLLTFLLSYDEMFKSIFDALIMQFNEANISYDIVQLQLTAKGTTMFSIIIGVVLAPLGTLLLAGIYHGISCIFDNKGKYKEVLSYMFYVGLISSVGGVLGGIITYTAGIYPISFSLAMFIEPTTSPVLHSILSMLSIFNIWYYGALIIGFKKIEELSGKKASFVILIVPVALAIVSIGAMVLFTAM